MESNKLKSIREISKKIEADSLEFLKNKYVKVSEYNNGIYYDPNYISPVSKSAHNLDSKILLILQDWASVDSLNKQEHTPEKINSGIDLTLKTNKNLSIWLEEFFEITFNQTYAINLFPYIKFGNMSAYIPFNDYLYSIKNFTEPFIESFQPKLTIVIGVDIFNVLRRFTGLPPVKSKEAYLYPFEFSNRTIIGVPHTGHWGTVGGGGEIEVKKMWKTLSDNYRQLIQ